MAPIGNIGIIIITAHSALEERLAGFDTGADDFLVKPFATAELAARVRAVVRRSAQQASDVWTFGQLQIEPKSHLVRVAGRSLNLSSREFRLLLELCRVAGTVVSKDVRAQRLEPLGDPVDFGAIEVHVSNLRRRVGAQRIRTVRGVGYMLVL
jgi:two-component system response regulator QseB